MGPVRRRHVLLLSAAWLTAGCLAPTLPLPPPTDPEVTGPDAQGLVTVTGAVEPRAFAFVLNAAKNDGRVQQTGDNGFYSFTLPAEVGDEMWLWYTIGGEESPTLVFSIK